MKFHTGGEEALYPTLLDDWNSAASARDDAVRAGIVINGLPILALEADLRALFHRPRDRRPIRLRHRDQELRDFRRRDPEEAHPRDGRDRIAFARGAIRCPSPRTGTVTACQERYC